MGAHKKLSTPNNQRQTSPTKGHMLPNKTLATYSHQIYTKDQYKLGLGKKKLAYSSIPKQL